jgi:hypothetical protein
MLLGGAPSRRNHRFVLKGDRALKMAARLRGLNCSGQRSGIIEANPLSFTSWVGNRQSVSGALARNRDAAAVWTDLTRTAFRHVTTMLFPSAAYSDQRRPAKLPKSLTVAIVGIAVAGDLRALLPDHVKRRPSIAPNGTALFIRQLRNGSHPMGPEWSNSELAHFINQRGAR